MSKQSPAARAVCPIRLPAFDYGALCASHEASAGQRQELASGLLDTVCNLLVQFPYEDDDNKVLAYHVVWACSWLTSIGKGLLDSLDVAKEGA